MDIRDCKIGDKVRATKSVPCLVGGYVYTIVEIRPFHIFVDTHADCDQLDPCSRTRCGGWEPNLFELVESAEVKPNPELEMPEFEEVDARHSCYCSIDLLMRDGCLCGGK